jgi:hypothetical protein
MRACLLLRAMLPCTLITRVSCFRFSDGSVGEVWQISRWVCAEEWRWIGAGGRHGAVSVPTDSRLKKVSCCFSRSAPVVFVRLGSVGQEGEEVFSWVTKSLE